MNPQEGKKVNYSKQKRPAPCPEPIWTLTFHPLIGLVGLACANEVFHLLFFPCPFHLSITNTESAREKILWVLETSLFKRMWLRVGEGCVCDAGEYFFFSFFYLFSREELLKPMGLKPDGTITPLEEALSQYSVIEETSSDTD